MAKNSFKNILLLKEFKSFLRKNFGEVSEEVIFNKIMETKRRYRADYLLADKKIIIEINGGQFVNGRHNRAGKVKGKLCTQYEDDLNKLNLAQRNGFKVFQFTYQQLARLEYKEILEGL